MAFYYNPVSGDVTKVTAAEKRAYDEHFREERWTKLLDNETTIPTLVAAFTAVAGTAFAAWFLNVVFGYLAEKGGDVSAKAKEAWTGAAYGGTLLVNVIAKPLTGAGEEAVVLPGDYQPPATITYNQLWDYAQKKYLFKDYFRDR